ncbi:MAG: hypothetical protein KJP00_10555 [Bacteroidia bacterium]|nr:hypothetical protein [Bacteroidia bacterium]
MQAHLKRQYRSYWIIVGILMFGLFLPAGHSLYAQVTPGFFPQDIDRTELEPSCFCKPGVRFKSRSKGLKLVYGTTNSGYFKPENFELTPPRNNFRRIEQYEIDIKAPLVLKDNFNLIVGYKLFKESFRFDNIGNDYENVLLALRGESLRSSTITAYMTKPLNETKYLIGVFRYSSNGNYGSKLIAFENRYAIYKMFVAYVHKPTPDKEIGFGLNVQKSFRRFAAIPLIIYNKTFNNRWGIEAILPGSFFGRYNFGARAIALMGFEFSGKTYRLSMEDDMNPFDYSYNHSEISGVLRYERHLYSWIWANFKVGWRVNFRSEFEAKSDFSTDFQMDPTDGLFLQLGIFVSPGSRD